MSATAKAWHHSVTGPPSKILSLIDLPIPTLPPSPTTKPQTLLNETWLLIKISYTGLNPGTQLAFNILPSFARAKTCTPELDFSGTVLDVWSPQTQGGSVTLGVGDDEPEYKKGDRVLGFLPISYTYPTGEGTLASHIRVPIRYVVKCPDNVSLEQAGGLMCATCSAVMLVEEAKVKKGDRVLVVGASGGIGTSVVQLAKHVVGESGFVVGVCSGRNEEIVKKLGADEVIDYTQHTSVASYLTQNFASQPFEAIIDCHGNQDLYLHCAQYLKASTYVACSAQMKSWTTWDFLRAVVLIQSNTYWPVSPYLGGVGRKFKLIAMMDPGKDLMKKVTQYVHDGTIKVHVDSVWGSEDVVSAYDIVASGRARGKVLVKWD